jgi:hypothetical protein
LYCDSQKIDQVQESAKSLQLYEHVVLATQTGYKCAPLGIALHLVALSIYFGWFAELAMTTSQLSQYLDDHDSYVAALNWFVQCGMPALSGP